MLTSSPGISQQACSPTVSDATSNVRTVPLALSTQAMDTSRPRSPMSRLSSVAEQSRSSNWGASWAYIDPAVNVSKSRQALLRNVPIAVPAGNARCRRACNECRHHDQWRCGAGIPAKPVSRDLVTAARTPAGSPRPMPQFLRAGTAVASRRTSGRLFVSATARTHGTLISRSRSLLLRESSMATSSNAA